MRNLAQTKDKLIVRIPCVRGIRPIVVEPQTVVVTFEVKDVRVAVPICDIWYTIRATAQVIRKLRKDDELYFIRDQKSPSIPHQVSLF